MFKQDKTIIKVIVISLFLFSFVVFSFNSITKANTERVTVTELRTPGFYWCQHSNGDWSLSGALAGSFRVPNHNGEPTQTRTNVGISIVSPTSGWRDSNNNIVNYSEIKNIRISSVTMNSSASAVMNGIPTISSDGQSITLLGTSGQGVQPRYNGTACGSNPNLIYPAPMNITWEGEIEVQQQFEPTLRVDPTTATIPVGTQTAYRAFLSIPGFGEVDVSNSSSTTWTITHSNIATNTRGIVTGVSVGQTTIRATHVSEGKTYNATATVNVTSQTLDYWLSIEPVSQTIDIGEEAEYRAFLNSSSGQKINVSLFSQWSLDDSTIAVPVVTSGRILEGIKGGSTKVRARYYHTGINRWLEASADLHVNTPVTPIVIIPTLRITPPEQTVRIGGQASYRAILEVGGVETDITDNLGTNWFIQSTPLTIATNFRNNVTGIRQGQTNIIATYNHNGTNLTAHARVIVEPTPVSFQLRPPEQTIKVGETAQYRAFFSIDGQPEFEITDNIIWNDWGVGDFNIAFPNFDGSYRGIARGTTQVTAAYTFENRRHTAEATLHVLPNPPVVAIQAPQQVIAGTYFCINAQILSSPNGQILDYNWTYTGEGNVTTRDNCNLYYLEVGQKEVQLQVTDEIGEVSNIATATINVLEPRPTANLTIPQDGTSRKENRRVDINSVFSTPKYFPIDWNKSYLRITPVNSAHLGEIRYRGMDYSHNQNGSFTIPVREDWTGGVNIHTSNTGLISIQHFVQSLYKLQGQYDITLFVENTFGLSATATARLNISEDLPPIANFSTNTEIFRNPSNQNRARITAIDLSQSIDNDTIQQRIWRYRYDSNNDGNFNDEDWITINAENQTSIAFDVPHVGYYELRLEVVEQFGQPTLAEFVTTADLRRGNTNHKPSDERIIRVGNRAPNVRWGP